MNRYEYMKDLFFQSVESNCFSHNKQKAYLHSIQVMNICRIFAQYHQLDYELLSIIGLFHDYSQFIQHTSFQHALQSAHLTKQIMEDSQLFSTEEINCVYQAIAHHSNKKDIHDVYSECLKDADVLAQHMEEPDAIFSSDVQARFQKYLFFYDHEAKK